MSLLCGIHICLCQITLIFFSVFEIPQQTGNGQEGQLEYCDWDQWVNTVAVSGSRVYRQCVTRIPKEDVVDTGWETFSKDEPHQYTHGTTRGKPFNTHFFFSPFSLLYKNVIQKYLDITFNEGICQPSEKKCSCITDRVRRFPSHSLCHFLSAGSLFQDKDHEGNSQYWGITVGGRTGARCTQRRSAN